MSTAPERRRARDPRTAPGAVATRTSAAMLGTLPLCWFFSTALSALLPLSDGQRAALCLLLVIPLWVTAMSFAFLAKSGVVSWLACLAGSALLYAITAAARDVPADAARSWRSDPDAQFMPLRSGEYHVSTIDQRTFPI